MEILLIKSICHLCRLMKMQASAVSPVTTTTAAPSNASIITKSTEQILIQSKACVCVRLCVCVCVCLWGVAIVSCNQISMLCRGVSAQCTEGRVFFLLLCVCVCYFVAKLPAQTPAGCIKQTAGRGNFEM